MHPYILPLSRLLKAEANAEAAAGAKAYLLNQFEHFGIATAVRRKLCVDYIKQNDPLTWDDLEEVVKELWQMPEREYQHCAIEIVKHHKKVWKKNSIRLMEHCLTHKSWWDSVDGIASDWLTDYFRLFPGEIISVTGKWNKSQNIWLQRSSIMFQKAFKKDTDTTLLSAYIIHLKDSKEFFIQKAIGWALREYSKIDPQWVEKFVNQHKLAPLSTREALKRINRE
ncbi:MAG: DNA alkylation repair protein [Filimonas sp.]|nr:DNA alkylation repair protein [Filimonas sp.]